MKDIAALPLNARIATVHRLLGTVLHDLKTLRINASDKKKRIAELEMSLGFLTDINKDMKLFHDSFIQSANAKLKFSNLMKRLGDDIAAEKSFDAAIDFIESVLWERGL
jgi:prefoldin subunit 5